MLVVMVYDGIVRTCARLRVSFQELGKKVADVDDGSVADVRQCCTLLARPIIGQRTSPRSDAGEERSFLREQSGVRDVPSGTETERDAGNAGRQTRT